MADVVRLGSTEMHRTVAAIDPGEWQNLFGGLTHLQAYLHAIERTSNNFKFSVIAIRRAGKLIAVAPVFQLQYGLDEAFSTGARWVADKLARVMPELFRVPVMIMGSPFIDECPVGLAGSDTTKSELLTELLAAFEAHASAAGVRMLAIKDVTDLDARWAHDALLRRNYARIASLPIAVLKLPFRSRAEYIASLKPKMRSDLKRKMRQSVTIRTEIRDTLNGIESRIIELYEQTQARRKFDFPEFDHVPVALFAALLRDLPGMARLMLCWLDDSLVGFNLFVQDGQLIVGKFIGMDYSVAHSHNLYFVNWLNMVDHAIACGVTTMQLGQTSYVVKVNLGCTLNRSWVYVKSGPLLGALLRLLGPGASFAAKDPDVVILGDAAPYNQYSNH